MLPSHFNFAFSLSFFCIFSCVCHFVFVFCTEKFFDMPKKQCRDALEIYKRFLARMERCAEFLKVAEVRRKQDTY